MRIPKNNPAQSSRVLTKLRISVKAGAGVVEVHMPGRIQTSKVGRSERIERLRRRVFWMGAQELGERVVLSH